MELLVALTASKIELIDFLVLCLTSQASLFPSEKVVSELALEALMPHFIPIEHYFIVWCMILV